VHNHFVAPHVQRRDEAVILRELGADAEREIVYIDEGWDSRVYLVNGGEMVFKFPRSDAVRARFHLEVEALRLLEDVPTTVAIPKIRHEGPGLEYFAYAGVVGRSLAETVAALTTNARRAVGTAIGQFLRVLHRLDLDRAVATPVDAEGANYAAYLESGRPALVQRLTARELRVVEAFVLEELPAAITGLGSDLRLCHADLGPWNIIVPSFSARADEAQRRGAGESEVPVGVIDFGDIGYYDASKDFSGFGDDVILDAALDGYGADELLRAKSALRAKAFPVLDLPFFVGRDDRAGADACIERVRRRIVDSAR
jgi:Ser/Thr protein kinase RdoA (MazF antagonist)